MTESTEKKMMINRRTYNSFIEALDIVDIRLVSAKVENIDCNYVPENAEVKWSESARYENAQNKIMIFHKFNVRILEGGKDIKAKIGVTFCVSYDSKKPMTDALFEIFRDRNLPVNSWPYFREFLHSVVLRMGWPPFIAPTFVA